MTCQHFPRVALFDLDGTLLDSAPDFLATLAAMCAERGRPAVAPGTLRPVVSKGSRAMLSVAFPELDEVARDALVPEFLERYETLIGTRATLFDGVAAMLEVIEADGARWGIVTNKPHHLAQLILPQHGWQHRCAVLVGGDTLAERKPHPLPLLHAAQVLGVAPGQCVYVGDDERDILAARAAGMPSVAALWGYRLQHDDPSAWRAEASAQLPQDLLDPAFWPALPAAPVLN
ncbi:phosphoglycolate phosphatase [Xanthomonas sp. 60]